MYTEKIKLEIEGLEVDCEVEFEFTKGEPARLFCHPEDRQPETPDEWEISGLTINALGELVDISFLIEILDLVIIEKLEELRDEL